MESFEECLLKYRQTLIRLLYRAGVPSNPGVTDDWILLQVARLIQNQKPPHICGFCGQNFSSVKDLFSHQNARHNSIGVVFSELGLSK